MASTGLLVSKFKLPASEDLAQIEEGSKVDNVAAGLVDASESHTPPLPSSAEHGEEDWCAKDKRKGRGLCARGGREPHLLRTQRPSSSSLGV